ncbi:MAG: gliding motility-associated C-terminal domain-containing protein [Bacteroidetes bacterium]|nr:gliding motility-associated C-terminal domain-containing protein [Bacteroidota bacterium]
MKQSFYTILILFLFTFANAQINPPEFLCVENDTLFWNLPSNSCGPFISYQIFVSDLPTGPFSLLDEVTDELEISFFPGNQGGLIKYYYLLSNYDCPGEIPIASDTLNNRPPEISPIESASVEGGLVQLSWEASPSPEVVGYIIYRETNIGLVPIDTVFNDLLYIDIDADPTNQSETYFVNALDACGNTSIFDLPHQTILLETSIDPCTQSVNLSWSFYQNWSNGIGQHEIWVSENGNLFFLAATVLGNSDTYSFIDGNDGSDYCFIVRAIEDNTGIISNSNEVCLSLDIVEPVEYLFIKNVSINDFNSIELVWEWNTDAEISGYNILRSIDNENFEIIATETIQPPLDPQEFYFDNTVNPSDSRYFYKIETIDICGDTETSDSAPTMFLSGTAQTNQINQLFWTPLNLDNLINIQYELFKKSGNQTELIAEYFGSPAPHLDKINPNNIEESKSCYYVIATSELIHPVTGTLEIIRTKSNTVCLEQFAEIIAPNAFTPNGQNQEFRPIVILSEIIAYQMLIYNRFGEKLFESRNLSEGWNGKKNGVGKDLPQGPYTFYIKVVQPNGQIVESQGIVILLH